MFKNNNYTISSELKYKPDVARLCTIHSQLLHQVHMMSHITCPLRFLCWVHVMSFNQMSSLPSSLSSSLSICLVQVPCDVMSQLSSLPSSLSSSLSICLLQVARDVIQPAVCSLVCPVHYLVAVYKLHVMSYSQLSGFHPSLSSPFFSCIVLGAC